MERKPSCLLAEARLLQPVTEGYGAKQVLDEKWLWDLCRDALRGRGGWEGADPLSPDSPKPFQSNRWGSLGKRLRFARWCCPLARWEAALFSSQAPGKRGWSDKSGVGRRERREFFSGFYFFHWMWEIERLPISLVCFPLSLLSRFVAYSTTGRHRAQHFQEYLAWAFLCWSY